MISPVIFWVGYVCAAFLAFVTVDVFPAGFAGALGDWGATVGAF
jgi:hypothetical protein